MSHVLLRFEFYTYFNGRKIREFEKKNSCKNPDSHVGKIIEHKFPSLILYFAFF